MRRLGGTDRHAWKPHRHTHPVGDGDDAAAERGEQFEPPDDGKRGQPEKDAVELADQLPRLEVDGLWRGC